MNRYRQIFVVLDFTFELRNTGLLREKRLQLVMTILLPQRMILREETKSDVDILREREIDASNPLMRNLECTSFDVLMQVANWPINLEMSLFSETCL